METLSVREITHTSYGWNCPRCERYVESDSHPNRCWGLIQFWSATEKGRQALVEWHESDWDYLCWKCQREFADEYDDHVKR